MRALLTPFTFAPFARIYAPPQSIDTSPETIIALTHPRIRLETLAFKSSSNHSGQRCSSMVSTYVSGWSIVSGFWGQNSTRAKASLLLSRRLKSSTRSSWESVQAFLSTSTGPLGRRTIADMNLHINLGGLLLRAFALIGHGVQLALSRRRARPLTRPGVVCLLRGHLVAAS